MYILYGSCIQVKLNTPSYWTFKYVWPWRSEDESDFMNFKKKLLKSKAILVFHTHVLYD